MLLVSLALIALRRIDPKAACHALDLQRGRPYRLKEASPCLDWDEQVPRLDNAFRNNDPLSLAPSRSAPLGFCSVRADGQDLRQEAV